MFDFNKKPYIRILIPYILGITGALYFNLKPVSWVFLLGIVAVIGALIYLNKSYLWLKRLTLICADLFLFLLGIYLTDTSQLINQPDFYGKKINTDSIQFIAVVNEIPVQKNKTLKALLELKSIKLGTDYHFSKGNIIAYLQNSQANNYVKAGSVLLIKTKLQEIKEPLNPHVFNLKKYFNDKSIYHTCFVDSSSFLTLNSIAYSKSLKQYGLAIKSKIVEQLKNNGLSKDASSICSALITGYDDDIDNSVIEAFAHSGTLHVLSVSGLHVGVIYMVLIWFVRLFDRKNKYKLTQLLIISICLWFFAFITGLSAPVLRAVIMFNLLGIGKLYFNNKASNQINILFVSAFVVLFINPLLIRDIGFLLSYSALFGILYFYPKLNLLYMPDNKLMAKIWQSTVVSVSATIATLPITLLVFHQLPIWFVLTNLIVVPYSFVLLGLSFLALFKIGIIVSIINKLTAFLVSFIRFFNAEKYSYIDFIDFNFTDAVFLVLIIYSASILFLNRRYNWVVFTIVLIISWQLFSLMDSIDKKRKNELVIYHTPKSSTVLVKNKNKIHLNKIDSTNFNYSIKPNITAANYPRLIQSDFNYLNTKNYSLIIIKDKSKIPMVSNRKIDYLLICNNSVPPKQFFEKKTINKLIADGSNNFYTLRKLEELCSKFGVDYYSTATKGAFIANYN